MAKDVEKINMPDATLDKYLAEDKLKYLAQAAIEKFAEISSIAAAKLSEDDSYSSGMLAAPNHDAYRSLRGISNTMRQEYQKLRSEPAIGRVVIHFPEKGEVREYYICRAAPPTGSKNLISYRSPMGRLASLELGEEYDLGEETKLERFDEEYIVKIQQASFIPMLRGNSWDSHKTEYRDANDPNFKTINSLIKIIEQIEDTDPLQFLQQFLQEEEQKSNITDGIRKDIVEKFSLPDQVFLDAQQDSIFRLPLNYSLLLLGPAGTGKTTTLIRRLGQKLDFDNGLMDDEKNLALRIFGSEEEFKSSWIMFTPTDLLKSYLKEAFNRENVPASDDHITTWESYRNELGRYTLRILQTAKFEAGFSPDAAVMTMKEDFGDWPELSSEFHEWLIAGYLKELAGALEKSKSFGFFKDDGFISKLGEMVTKKQDPGKLLLGDIFTLLLDHQKNISELYNKEKDVIDGIVNKNLGLLLKSNRLFLDNYSEFLASLEKSESAEADEGETIDSEIMDDEDEAGLSGNEKIRNAIRRYRSFILWLAGRPAGFGVGKSKSKNAKQLEWFGDRLPSAEVLKTLDQSAVKAKCLGTLYNPLNKFLNSIAPWYGKFRKEKQSEGRFYHPDSALRKKISYGELDMLIFVKLKIATELLRNIHIDQDDTRFTSSLRLVKEKYKAQVFVDEAPDFSPMQHGCMKLLAHPKINSFFACGDFNQRIVSDGTKDAKFLLDFLPGSIREEYITIPYRQTKSLFNFSLRVLELTGANRDAANLQENIHAIEGYHPALGENLGAAGIPAWLAKRILEIENTLDGNIPSTAILVPSEEDVAPVQRKLKEILNEKTSIHVQACHEGQTIGDGRAIRVFDIKHIKGLEFEAAFFVSFDKLASLYPDLIGNYLYVGATRAVQFLGVTCTGNLPDEFGTILRNEFVADWQT